MCNQPRQRDSCQSKLLYNIKSGSTTEAEINYKLESETAKSSANMTSSALLYNT